MTEMRDLEQHRRELTGYCYRMLGSAFEADDAVQETLVRAWRAQERFEGRSSLRTWLYRIATRVCLDMLEGRSRRARPMDRVAVGSPEGPAGAELPASEWVEPVPDVRLLSVDADPSEELALRQTIRLAFVAALQHLPSRQRAVLILREVLAWPAQEVADLLETTVASVNSALQRARTTLGSLDPAATDAYQPLADAQKQLLDQYVEAFERYDMDALASLLHEEVVLSMPPLPLWLRGPGPVRQWMEGLGSGCRGSRLVPTVANGSPAFGQYRPAPGGGWRPWALQILEISGGHIVGVNNFLDTSRWFPLFGLPPEL